MFPAAPEKKAWYRRPWLAALVLAIVLLLALELLARQIVPVGDESWSRLSADPVLAWEGVPNVAFEYTGLYKKLDHCPCPVTLNSQGWHDRERSPRKPAGTFRLVGLGCNEMAGFGVSFAETKLQYLESLLGDAAVEPAVEAINLGVPGYRLTQSVENLKVKGFQYQPDIVLVSTFLQNLRTPFQVVPAYHQLARVTHSRALKAITMLLDRKNRFDLFHESRYTVKELERSLRELGESAAQNRVTVVHVFEERIFESEQKLAQAYQRLVQENSQTLIYFRRDFSRPDIYQADGHLNGRGNRFWAETVVCGLIEGGLLPPAVGERARQNVDCQAMAARTRSRPGPLPPAAGH